MKDSLARVELNELLGAALNILCLPVVMFPTVYRSLQQLG
jgi:hypothetical protein